MSKIFKIGLVDDNIFMLNSIEEKLSLFDRYQNQILKPRRC